MARTNTKNPPRTLSPLAVKLLRALRVLKLWELEHPSIRADDDAAMLVRSLIAHDPHVERAAVEHLDRLDGIEAWCRECGFQWVKVPLIGKCERCGGRQLAKGTT